MVGFEVTSCWSRSELPSHSSSLCFEQQRHLYRPFEKLFQKKRFRYHIILEKSAHIDNGLHRRPIWWDAINQHPMISIPRVKQDWKRMTDFEDDRLIKLVLKDQPHLADEPHALAAGLDAYYVHPVKRFVLRWKELMAKGMPEQQAYQQVLIEQWRDTVADKIEHDVQVHQASMFGVPAPDVQSQLASIDRDMEQAKRAGVVSLKLSRFETMRRICEKKLANMREAAPDRQQRIAKLLVATQAAVFPDQIPKEDIEDMETALKSVELSPSVDRLTVDADSDHAEDLHAEDTARLREQIRVSNDPMFETTMGQIRHDVAIDNNGGEDINTDQEAALPDVSLQYPYIVNGPRPLNHNDVRIIMTDEQFEEFRGFYPEFREAFDPILWSGDTFFAEQMAHGARVVDEQFADPSAAGLKAKEQAHLFELAKLGPFLGVDPQLEPHDPYSSPDIQKVTELMDLIKMIKSVPELLEKERLPDPKDLIDYPSDRHMAQKEYKVDPNAPNPAQEPEDDPLFENFYLSDGDEQHNPVGTKTTSYPSISPADLKREMDDSKATMLSQLEALRAHLQMNQRIDDAPDYRPFEDVYPHPADGPQPGSK